MEQTKPKIGKKYILLMILAVVLALGLLLAKPLWYSWCDLSFYWTERTETELRVKAYAEEQGISIAEYPRSLIELLERNPETEGFVLNYPFREDVKPDLSAYGGTDTVPLFLQWDPQWGYEKYGSDVLGITGCGPTCLAMVGFYLTGEESYTPDQVAKFAAQNGYYEKGYGSSWTLISEGGPEIGLQVKELPLVKKKLTNALEAGHPVILAMGPGDFTSTGHYIVLTGIEEGGFRVNDPNSGINSRRFWTYEELEGQIRNIWELWVE